MLYAVLHRNQKANLKETGDAIVVLDPGKDQGKKGMEKGWLVGTAGYKERLLRFWISWT